MSAETTKPTAVATPAPSHPVTLYSQDWGLVIRRLIYDAVVKMCPSMGEAEFDHHDILAVAEILEKIACTPENHELEFKALAGNDSQLAALETYSIGVSERFMRDENAEQEVVVYCHSDRMLTRLHGISFAASALAIEMKAIAMQAGGQSTTLN